MVCLQMVSEAELPSSKGHYRLQVYRDTDSGHEHLAFLAGDLQQYGLMLHVHHVQKNFRHMDKIPSRPALELAQRIIVAARQGIILYIKAEPGEPGTEIAIIQALLDQLGQLTSSRLRLLCDDTDLQTRLHAHGLKIESHLPMLTASNCAEYHDNNLQALRTKPAQLGQKPRTNKSPVT